MSKSLGQPVLADAIALLEPPGSWCRFSFRETKRSGLFWNRKVEVLARCIDAAIVDASVKYGGDVAADQARNLLYRYGGWTSWWSAHPGSIQRWNDAPGRTHAEVLDFARGALATA